MLPRRAIILQAPRFRKNLAHHTPIVIKNIKWEAKTGSDFEKVSNQKSIDHWMVNVELDAV